MKQQPSIQLATSPEYLYRQVGGVTQRRRHDWPGSVRWETITNEDHGVSVETDATKPRQTRRRRARNRS